MVLFKSDAAISLHFFLSQLRDGYYKRVTLEAGVAKLTAIHRQLPTPNLPEGLVVPVWRNPGLKSMCVLKLSIHLAKCLTETSY